MQIGQFESMHQPLAPMSIFFRRLLNHFTLALAVTVVSLAIGTLGYHWLAGSPWVDAFLNASMLLGGMGPVGDIATTAGKLFASFYALYAGLMFITVSGIVLSPLLHRLMHKFHIPDED